MAWPPPNRRVCAAEVMADSIQQIVLPSFINMNENLITERAETQTVLQRVWAERRIENGQI
jgi:hypothetical protein